MLGSEIEQFMDHGSKFIKTKGLRDGSSGTKFFCFYQKISITISNS